MNETLEKKQVKEALYEYFQSDNHLFKKIITDAIEEIALGKAIEIGDVGDYFDEEIIMNLLNIDSIPS